MKLTIDEVMDLGPCGHYTRELILEISGGREEIDVNELADLDMPVRNLLWIASELLPEEDMRMIAAAFAESVLPLFERKYPTDHRPRNAIKAARLYAMGEISASADYAGSSYSAAAKAARGGFTQAAAAADAAADSSCYSSNAATLTFYSAGAAAEERERHREIIRFYLGEYNESVQ